MEAHQRSDMPMWDIIWVLLPREDRTGLKEANRGNVSILEDLMIMHLHFCQDISHNFTILILCYVGKLNMRKSKYFKYI